MVQSTHRHPISLLWVALAIVALVLEKQHAFAQSVNTKERSVVKVAEGVYVIRHPDAPDGFPQGNTTVIIGDREVLVVDACYLPSSARQDIDQIRQWTTKPVKFLVNTHWHYDHTMGNGVYAEVFPSINIVAHSETQKHIKGYNPGWFERFPGRAATFKEYAETGKAANGRTLSEQERKEYAEYLKGIEPVQAEFKKLADKAPNLSFSEEMNVDLGNREVQLKFLGRGNTSGDIVIFLPTEKILIAGDLLDHPVPYLGGGYPSQLAKTLQRLAMLDAETVIPGHGEVLKAAVAKPYLKTVTEFIQTVAAEVSRQVYLVGSGPRNLEKVQAAVDKNIDVESWRKKIAGTDKDNVLFFDTFSYPGLVVAAYAEVWGR